MAKTVFSLRLLALGASVLALGACDRIGSFDFDLRGGAGQFDTSDAVRNASQGAPQPDERGVVSYPNYQVAIARRGDTVGTIAARVGLTAEELSRYNAIPQNVALREGEVIALPSRVGEPGSGVINNGTVDVSTIAGAAINRAENAPGLPRGDQPVRHQVAPGETAFSIARLYNVPVAMLAEWNGLGTDLALRDGQYLLIPVKTTIESAAIAPPSRPGTGTATPLPPSSAKPLPEKDEKPVAEAKPKPSAKPATGSQTAASDTARLQMPVQGRIIRPFQKGKNEGIGIAADAGTTVAAADAGSVAAITRDTEGVPILVLRHEGNLLTVYAGVDEIRVKKGDKVKRGQKIATVRSATPPFLHFEVREGFDSVDPTPFLK